MFHFFPYLLKLTNLFIGFLLPFDVGAVVNRYQVLIVIQLVFKLMVKNPIPHSVKPKSG